MEANILNLIIQGTPYGILAAGLITVWSRYQTTLDQKEALHIKHADIQQKLIDLLLSKVEKD